MSLWNRIREVARNLDVRRFDDRPLTSKPVGVSEKPVSVTQPPSIKAANEAINALPPAVGFDRAAFFAHLRGTTLRHRQPEQVAGTEAILDACKGLPISWTAYALATAYHETGGKMSPNVESLNYSVAGLLNTFGRHRISRADAERLGRKAGRPAAQRQIANIIYGGSWGRDNLGNTEPDDGWMYRGRGMAHDTGRRNYRLSGEAVGIDLLSDPDALLDVSTAAKVMVSGMKSGRYTGHTFARHLPATGEAAGGQFENARRIINGTDKASQIAGYALKFQAALKSGGWA